MKKERRFSTVRRKLLKGAAALPLLGSLTMASAVAAGSSLKVRGYLSDEAVASLRNLKGDLSRGKMGKYEISRLILGCNPMGGWSHARDLGYVGTLSKRWHTHDKMKETWAIAEQAGINFVNLVEFQYPVFNEYKRETGSRMVNVCQCSIGTADDRLVPVKKAVDDGADLIYIQGQHADRLATSGSLDVLFQAMDYVHRQNMLFGVGAHSIKTILKSRDMGIHPDFYYKTFHHDNYWSATPREYRQEYPVMQRMEPAEGEVGVLPGSPDAPRANHNAYHDNMWDQFPEQTIEAFRSIDVPFFGFKVMAAGAITPADGIRWAFENGADFICVGMYDFQVVENVNTTIEVLDTLGERQRPWRG